MKNALGYTEIYQLWNFFGYLGRVFLFLHFNKSRKQRDGCWPPIGKFVPNQSQAFQLKSRGTGCLRVAFQGLSHLFFPTQLTVGPWSPRMFFDLISRKKSLADRLSQCRRAILKGSMRIQKVNSNTYVFFFFYTASQHRSYDEALTSGYQYLTMKTKEFHEALSRKPEIFVL